MSRGLNAHPDLAPETKIYDVRVLLPAVAQNSQHFGHRAKVEGVIAAADERRFAAHLDGCESLR
ncbi:MULTISPECIES: hypothetical protein [unclassified Bradyrhizobium]|uniref:hypothetical protein n=1 Tax=Bradyrhizobium sp. USDA 4541 TaxID=2817704 RepID=UPI0020A2C7F8|nr:hypothetical protein [Bradyrhizobium sp. USDA 4541]MCP1854463.1 hypothetical protein [Bradyrhizobium sp. USDA 4541]